MKVTVIQIRAALAGLPDDMVVEFVPITGAYMGASNPLRFSDINVYTEDGCSFALPGDEGAVAAIHLVEHRP